MKASRGVEERLTGCRVVERGWAVRDIFGVELERRRFFSLEEARSGGRVFLRREGRQRKEERFSGTFIVDSLLVSIGMFFCSVSVDP